MKHLSKRIAALAMALAMTLTLTTWASAADYADMPENWAKAPMEAAVEAGLLQGSDGLLRPTDHLTRAEMAAIVVRAFGATQSADVSKFSDVDANAWYVAQNAVPGAVFMQIMKGNANGTFEPGKYITREQAFAILARALKLEAGDAAALEKFSDAADVSSWATGEVAALAAAGYVNGSDGKLNPQGLITRQEFAQVMYNIFGSYIKEAGTYSEVGERTLMISADGVTIEDATIHGDVIIGEGVGEGDVYFKNVTIEGRVVIRGGGVNSIHFINSDTAKVLVSKIEGAVRVVTDKASSVAEVAVVAGQDTVTVEGSVDKVAVEAETPVVVKDAEVKTVEVKTDSAKVEITGASKVEAVSVTADAQVGITGSSNVTKVEAASGTVTAGGEARVSTITTTGGDVKVEDTARVTTIEAPKTEDGAPAPTVTIADTATVSTVKAETDVTLDGKANRVEAPADVTVSDSNGNEVATTTPGGSTGPSYPSGGGTTTPTTPDDSTSGSSGGDAATDNRGDAEDSEGIVTTPTVPDAPTDTSDLTASDGNILCGSAGATATDHSWTKTTVKEVSCTEDGSYKYTCSTCGAEKTETVTSQGHSYTKKTVKTQPTCTDAGAYKVECANCGDVTTDEPIEKLEHSYKNGRKGYDETQHYNLCDYCDEKQGATSHTPTYTSTATQHTAKCVCGYTKTEAHVADPDTFAADKDADTHSKTCKTCNAKFGTTKHTWEASATQTGTDGSVDTQTMECKACSATKEVECSKKGTHANIPKGETCDVCGYVGTKEETVTHEHTLKYTPNSTKAGEHTVSCTAENCPGLDDLTDAQKSTTCDKNGEEKNGKQTCSKCGYEWPEEQEPTCTTCDHTGCIGTKGCTVTECVNAKCTCCQETTSTEGGGGENGDETPGSK